MHLGIIIGFVPLPGRTGEADGDLLLDPSGEDTGRVGEPDKDRLVDLLLDPSGEGSRPRLWPGEDPDPWPVPKS